MTLGEKIKQFRLNKGLKQSDLAIITGISRISIGYYERNDRQPGIEQVEKIAAALDVKPFDLMGWGYWDATHPEFYQALDDEEAFEGYLKSLGYSVDYESEGDANAPDTVTFSATIIRGKQITTLNADEYKELQAKYLEMRKKVKELEADCQDIVEMRIQKKAESKGN